MGVASIGLALVAGILSTLSPCVLPLLPVLLTTASSEHRFGPAALAAGLGLSFAMIGMFVATLGIGIGLDADLFRRVGAVLLASIGTALVLPALHMQLSAALGPLSNRISGSLGRFSTSGVLGQFLLGLLLGAVWSPCVGPTLGAATVLASQGSATTEVAAVMFTFGLGAALPLLIMGMASREALLRLRPSLLVVGRGMRTLLGMILVVMGIGIFMGFDKQLEAFLVEASPAWLTRLTTMF